MIPKPDTPLWGGPVKVGVTQSLMGDFLNCPFRFYLKTICGLEDVTDPHPNLVWGDCYHVGLEHLIQGDSLSDAKKAALHRLRNHWGNAQGFPAESYAATIPSMLAYYDLSLLPEGDWITEQEFDVEIDGYRYKGKKDGILPGVALAEHKCKGLYSVDPVLIAEEIETDLQCNLYMTVSEVETVYYDLIGIPESVKFGAPYKARNCDERQYGLSLVHGGSYKTGDKFPVKNNTHIWINQQPYVISAESQRLYWQRTIRPLTQRIHAWYDYVTSENFNPNNPECYNEHFYVTPVRTFKASNTEKFKCDFHTYLTGNEDISNLRKVKGMFQELPSANTE